MKNLIDLFKTWMICSLVIASSIYAQTSLQFPNTPPELSAQELAMNCKNNAYKDKAQIFVRNIRYLKVLKEFIDAVNAQISTRIDKINTLIYQIDDAKNTIKQNRSLIIGIQQDIQKQQQTITGYRTDFSAWTKDLQDIKNTIDRALSLQGKFLTQLEQLHATLSNRNNPQINALLNKSVNTIADAHMVQMQLRRLAGPQGFHYGILAEHLFLFKHAISTAPQMIQDIQDGGFERTNSLIQESMGAIQGAVNVINNLNAQITYSQQVIENNQTQITSLNSEITTTYIPLINQAKDKILAISKELQEVDKGIYSACPEFIEKTLKK